MGRRTITSVKNETAGKRREKLRRIEEREPVKLALQEFRGRMGWSQSEFAIALEKSFQSVQKYEHVVPDEVLDFCIAESTRKGWSDLAYMLGAPGPRLSAEPSPKERKTLDQVLTLLRKSEEFTDSLDRLINYHVPPASSASRR
ncbi:MAG: hypothetical protein WD733_15575 [Bryobacterales bacterium]